MKIFNKISIITAFVCIISVACDDFLEEEPQSQINAAKFYKDATTAEVGLTGVYNRFFNQNGYSYLMMLVQVSTDDVKQPSGAFFTYKDRANMLPSDANLQLWGVMYETIANANFLIAEVENISEAVFNPTPERKAQIIAEARFVRAMAYYYLHTGWGDVPLATEFPDDINEALIAKRPKAEVLGFVKSELEHVAATLPDVLEVYADDATTNARKGRASKWAAKAYLARLALAENDWQEALILSNEIIDSGIYPFTGVWKNIFQHPMNASESIFEQQNDFSPGFFGSGIYGWFFGFDFEWSDDAKSIFEKPDIIGETPGKDVRFDLAYTPHPWEGTFQPNKYLPSTGFNDGGAESMNFVIVRLSELLLNKAEALNEISFAGNKPEVIDILNMIRARAEDQSFINEWFADAPVGTEGIAPLDPADFTTQEALRQAIREERRRELFVEDVIRWVDLMRWDKDYLRTVTNSPTEDHLFWPIPPDEILRNPKLEQNPAFN